MNSKFTTGLLVLNLALVGVVAWLFKKTEPHPPAPAPPPVALQPDRPPAPVPIQPRTPAPAPTNDFRWSQLESEDYPTYIARLRQIGCPEQTIRDIVISDLDKLMAPKLLALNPVKPDLKYWEPDDKELWTDVDQRAWEAQRQQIDFEKRDIVQELLGADLVAEREKVRGQQDYFGRRLDFLPEEKRIEARKILERHSAEERAVREKTWEEGEPLDREDTAALRELQQSRDAELQSLFSPSEWDQYQLRLSPTAYEVRDSFFGMHPTEAEYLAVFRLREAFDRKWKDEPDTGANAGTFEQRQQDEAALDQSIALALGPERYLEYQRAQDPTYRQLRVAAARYGVSGGDVTEAYGLQRAFEEERTRLDQMADLDPEQRADAVRAMREETARMMQTRIGPRAYEYFRRHSGPSVR